MTFWRSTRVALGATLWTFLCAMSSAHGAAPVDNVSNETEISDEQSLESQNEEPKQTTARPVQEPGPVDNDVTSDDDLFSFEKSNIPFDASLELTQDPINADELEKESDGLYNQTKKELANCQSIPLDKVWSEFSPFFNYKWNKEFELFAALFLTMWKRESNFMAPKSSVIVQANCKNFPPMTVRALAGKNLNVDLRAAAALAKGIKRRFPGCNLRSADYGSLQWNYRWRLSSVVYRSKIEKALLITTSYRKTQLSKLKHKELANIVRFHPRALFILAGLDLSRFKQKPKSAIQGYNTNPDYWKLAQKNYDNFLQIIRTDKSCSMNAKKIHKSFSRGRTPFH